MDLTCSSSKALGLAVVVITVVATVVGADGMSSTTGTMSESQSCFNPVITVEIFSNISAPNAHENETNLIKQLTNQLGNISSQYFAEAGVASQQLELTIHQLDMDSQQLNATKEQVAILQQQLNVSNAQLAVAREELDISKDLLNVANQQLTLAHQLVAVSQQQLAVSSANLAVAHEELNVTRDQLSYLNEQQREFIDLYTQFNLPVDCSKVLQSRSGRYKVDLADGDIPRTFMVYCDMETNGGGWTVFQRRVNGTVDFYRNWTDYKRRFGELDGEHWLGNEILHRLTTHKSYRLRVDLEDWSGNTTYAEYSVFSVDTEDNNYRLTVDGYSGSAGNSLRTNNGMGFSTRDVQNDNRPPDQDCSNTNNYNGAWWYPGDCGYSNLNGLYYALQDANQRRPRGITWHDWKGNWHSLKTSEMKIKPN